jgi:hypothetical protein
MTQKGRERRGYLKESLVWGIDVDPWQYAEPRRVTVSRGSLCRSLSSMDYGSYKFLSAL